MSLHLFRAAFTTVSLLSLNALSAQETPAPATPPEIGYMDLLFEGVEHGGQGLTRKEKWEATDNTDVTDYHRYKKNVELIPRVRRGPSINP